MIGPYVHFSISRFQESCWNWYKKGRTQERPDRRISEQVEVRDLSKVLNDNFFKINFE